MDSSKDVIDSSNKIEHIARSSLRDVHMETTTIKEESNETKTVKEETEMPKKSSETEEHSRPVISRLLYIPSTVNAEENFSTKPEEAGFNMKKVLTSSPISKTFYKMNNSDLLREYRKKNKTHQSTMLRYIRTIPSSKSPTKMNGSANGENDPGCSSDPVENELNTSIEGDKQEESSPSSLSTTDSVKTEENELGSEDSCNEDDSPIVKSNFKAKKRCIIDSDDESEPSPKRHKPSDQFTPEMLDTLIDMYCELYPFVGKMQMYDHIREVDYNFVELAEKLDSLKLAKNSERKANNLAQLAEERRLREKLRIEEKQMRLNERDKQKSEKSRERLRRKKIWAIKGKATQDFEEDDGDDFIKTVKVYNSDSSDDEGESPSDQDPALCASRELVFNFFVESSVPELLALTGCSKKKADAVIQCRPFCDWNDLVAKFKMVKHVNTDLLNSAVDLIVMRNTIAKLMKKCESIASNIRSAVARITGDEETYDSSKIVQPSIINPSLSLKSYQIIGLNWLVLMYQQGLNGVLADEMGLGKTIQAIAFLAYLKEQNELSEMLCLIVVPSSTLDNWSKELEKWCPSLGVLIYHGSQDERRGMRADIVNSELDEHIYVMLTTYAMVTSTTEDKGLFKRIPFHTVIFDEAHMLKNMSTLRFENLMKIKAKNRLLLTGTPLQNNLVELMSILVFVMPQLFEGKKDMLKKIFSMFPKSDSKDSRGQYEKKRIEQANKIMMPFFLRRLKKEVLKDLPPKETHILHIALVERQQKIYTNTIKLVNDKAEQIKKEIIESKEEDMVLLTDDVGTKPKKALSKDSTSNILMTLRKISNHPLLVRDLYTDEKIKELATTLHKTTHRESLLQYIIEDLSIMSDFEIHKTCLMYRSISHHRLPDETILNSGKFKHLDEMLPVMKKNGDRVLIFSQFVITLDIIEDYMKIKGYSTYRLDGQTPVTERQEKIDDFNENDEPFAFLLSTRAGGLGINLSTANTVILHDIDFNPYIDKQAEDRCHRVGQTRNVSVYRFISENTIEQGMLSIASSKLQLEKDLAENDGCRKVDVLQLLESALAKH